MNKYGVKPGDVIIICSHNHLDTYIPIFATFYVGAIFNAWSHEISSNIACDLMTYMKPKLIFAFESIGDTLLKAAKSENVDTEIIVFGNYPGLQSLNDILQRQPTDEIRSFRPLQIKNAEETAIILLTSGSTGAQKSVMHSYGNLLKLLQTHAAYCMKSVALCNGKHFWLSGILLLLVSTFTRGIRIIHKYWDIEEGCRIVEKFKVQCLLVTPTMISYLCKSGLYNKYNLESLKLILIAGEIVNQMLNSEFRQILPNALIIVVYGLTETGRMVTCHTENTKDLASVGYVMPNTEIKIQDITNKSILGANQEGEICVRQQTIMTGYFKNPEETSKTIDEEGWIHTGDMGYYDDNGEITVSGRYTDLILCCNNTVVPVELEKVLLSHPSILEVAVVPIPHDIDVERPIAFVKKNSDVNKSELVELTLILGDRNKLSGGVEFLDELPKTPSGKINKPLLKEMAKTLKYNRDLMKPKKNHC